MKVILFGAGASFGSEKVIPFLPPVSTGLFDQLRKHYPEACGKITASDRLKFVPNFELGMKQLWDSHSRDTQVLMRCMADYFAKFRATQGNAYARLLEHLEYRDALEGTYFSTLNYECVLESAAREYGFRAIDYVSKKGTTESVLSVWKIHGSCNFLPKSVTGGSSAISYDAAGVSWNGDIKIVDPSRVGPFVSQSAFYPAMAVFMEGKPVRSHPGMIGTLQKWWKEAISKAKVVGVIGVRPNEQDTHIWNPLADTDALIVVIGNEPEYRSWAEKHRTGKATTVVGTQFSRDLPAFAEAFSQ